MGHRVNSSDVFINCPFDKKYGPFLQSLIFTISDCGFRPRCALEVDDSLQVRIDKICRLIIACPYGIHDISRTELDSKSKLPRFNMPLELGIFIGAQKFGAALNKKKQCLVLDKERYRYQKFISDISGQDIKSHNNDPLTLISVVRDWLRSVSGKNNLPGGSVIRNRYLAFLNDLTLLCKTANIKPREVTYADISHLISEWLKANAL